MPRKKPTARKTRAARRVVVAAGKAAADALNLATGAPVDDPEIDFGGPDLDEEDPEAELAAEARGELPAPPPAPERFTGDKPSEPPPGLLALGDPPADAAGAFAWLYRAMIVSAHDAMTDNQISAATRRKELRTISVTAAKLYPDSARYELAMIIKGDRAELEQRRRARAGAPLEAASAAPATARVIPIRSGRGPAE